MLFKSRRRKLLESRVAFSDDDFLRAVGAQPKDARFILAARRAVARVCRMAPEVIYPDDPPSMFEPLPTLAWDDSEVVLEIESELGIALGSDPPRFLPGRFFWRHYPAPGTFGEWAVKFAGWAINSVQPTAARSAVSGG